MDSKEKIEHNRLLRSCVVEWQKLLKLDEWNIAIGIGTKQSIGEETSMIKYDRVKAQALITIIDKDEVQVIPFGFNEEAEIIKQMLQLRYEMIMPSAETCPYLLRAHAIMADLLSDLKHNSDAYKRVLDEMSGVKDESARKATPRIINP